MTHDSLSFLNLAESAYRWAPNWGSDLAHVIADRYPDVVRIAFRGSASVADWFVDFAAAPHESAAHPQLGNVHAGFLASVLSVAQRILDDTGAAALSIAGHSKGGAEAQLFAALARAAGRTVLALYTFGAPAVAVSGEVSALIGQLPGQDFRNRRDPVPLLPPIGFHHPRALQQLGAGEGSDFLPISDHFLSAYRSSLKVST